MIVPVDVPLDGGTTTDTSGNYSFTSLIHPANWSAVRLVAQTTGSPRWTLLSDSSLPLDFAPGPLASMGLVLLAPGQRLTVQVLGATPNSAVQGHYVGVMSASLEEVLPFYSPNPNPVGTVSTLLAQVLGAVTTAVLAPPVSQSFPVPRGTQAIGFAGVQPLGGAPTVTVQGDQSGIQYFAANTAIPAGPPNGPAGQTVQAALLDPLDTSVTIAIQNASSSSTVNLLAWSTMPTTFARQLTGDVFQENVTDRVNRLLGQVRPQKYDGNGTNNPAVGTQATVTLPVSGANQRWVCAEVDADIFGAGGAVASVATLVLRDGASGAGTILRVWNMGVSGVGDKDHVLRSDLGIPGSLNSQMTLEFTAGVANVFEDVNIGAYLSS